MAKQLDSAAKSGLEFVRKADITLKDFFDYLKSAPLPVQLLGVAIIAAGIVFFGYSKFGNKTTDNQATSQAPTQNQHTAVISKGVAAATDYPNGTPDPQKGNGNAPSPDAKLQTDAAVWHNLNSDKDDPPWKDIYREPRTGSFLKYKYFSKSDGCLEIERAENGGPAVDRWVPTTIGTTPLHKNFQALLLPKDKARGTPVRSSEDEGARQNAQTELHYHLFELPRVLAATLGPKSGTSNSGIEGQMSGPQFCINPHPGPFTFYWGPVSGCQQPQFRTFADGCTHYQIFNMCAGAWEPQIYWTFCRQH